MFQERMFSNFNTQIFVLLRESEDTCLQVRSFVVQQNYIDIRKQVGNVMKMKCARGINSYCLNSEEFSWDFARILQTLQMASNIITRFWLEKSNVNTTRHFSSSFFIHPFCFFYFHCTVFMKSVIIYLLICISYSLINNVLCFHLVWL
jgi:hypothetical protein